MSSTAEKRTQWKVLTINVEIIICGMRQRGTENRKGILSLPFNCENNFSISFWCRKEILVDSFTEGVIRRKILEGYSQKKFYTVRRLHQLLQEDPNFPRIKNCSTLQKIMKKQLKFKFVKFHSKPIPFERHDVQVARHSFLRNIRNLRRQNYNVSALIVID